MQGNVAHHHATSQLSLPTGPRAIIRGGRPEPAKELPFLAIAREERLTLNGKEAPLRRCEL